ncbi:MAG: RICIN domain-containing protein [Coriobacteriia bacterium]|nr:RICIN domain-containing protein [Coriobacteriia bacterium]
MWVYYTPSGTTRQYSPQPGDIATWAPGSGYSPGVTGHVAVVVAVYANSIDVVQQDSNQPTRNAWIENLPLSWAAPTSYLRPDWKGSGPATSGGAPVYVENGKSYQLVPKVSTGRARALDVAGKNEAAGTNVWLWQTHDEKGQIFDFWERNDGAYHIYMWGTNEVLDTDTNRAESGLNVQIWDVNGCDGQAWFLEDAGDGWVYIRNKHGYYLDVDGGVDENCRNVHVWGFNGSDAQKWRVVRVSGTTRTTLETGTYQFVSQVGTKVLDVAGGLDANEANVFTYQPLDDVNQIFYVDYRGDPDANRIRWANGSWRLFDSQGGGPYAGQNLQLFDDNGGSGQYWFFEDAGDGWYYIRNLWGYYLDVDDGIDKNTQNVKVWHFNGSAAQKWKPVKVSGQSMTRIESGNYQIMSAVGDGTNGYVLDVADGIDANETNVFIYQTLDNQNQIFYIDYNGDPLFSNNIRYASGTRWLDSKGGGPYPQLNVQLYDGNGGPGQNWFFEDAGDGYYYIRNLWGFYLDVADGKAANGQNVQVFTFNGSDAQKWRLSRVSGGTRQTMDGFVDAGDCRLKSALGDFYLEATDNAAPGGSAQIGSDGSGNAQSLTIGWDDECESTTISFAGAGSCLETQDNQSGGLVRTMAGTYAGLLGQRWFFESAGDGYYYVRNAWGRYLAVDNAPVADGTIVGVFSFSGSDAQKWKLELVKVNPCAAGHSPNSAMRENVTAPTCTAAGSHDDVVYCGVCGTEISRTTVTDAALGHYLVTSLTQAPTCTEGGVSTTACTRCSHSVSTPVPAKGHTPGVASPENVQGATCTAAGSYDSVVRCTGCGAELSRTHVDGQPLGHSWDAGAVTKQPTETEEGVRTYTCTSCGETRTEAIPPRAEQKPDTAALADAVSSAQAVSRGVYTQASWTAFQQALAAAQAQLANPGTQAEVDAAAAALTAAQGALTRADAKQFPDVTDPVGQWFYNSVYRAADLGLFSGYGNGNFGPMDPLTRGQFAVVLWRYFNPEEAAAYKGQAANTSGMTDVASNAYYTPAINWAVETGYIRGFNSTTFGPEEKLSAEMLCVILCRIQGGAGDEASLPSRIADADQVSPWAREGCAWALENGVLSGYQNDDGTRSLRPGEDIFRGRAATILVNAIDGAVL